MGLNDEINEYLAKVRPNMPEEAKQAMAVAQEKLRAQGITEKACRAGDQAPDFALPNHRGRLISTEALRREGPLVLSFYRGSW